MRTPTPKALQVGGRIREARLRLGLSQDDLAKLLGVTKGLVSQYEGGLTSPHSKRWTRIAEVLKVSADWLLTGGEPEEQTKAQTRAELDVLLTMRDLSPDDQRRLARLVVAFAKDASPPREK